MEGMPLLYNGQANLQKDLSFLKRIQSHGKTHHYMIFTNNYFTLKRK